MGGSQREGEAFAKAVQAPKFIWGLKNDGMVFNPGNKSRGFHTEVIPFDRKTRCWD